MDSEDSFDDRHDVAHERPRAGVVMEAPKTWRSLAFTIVLRELPYFVMLFLAVFGIGYVSFTGRPADFIWMSLVPVFCIMCIIGGWRHAERREDRWRLIWTQVLHWLSFFVVMNSGLSSRSAKRREQQCGGHQSHDDPCSRDIRRGRACAGLADLRRGTHPRPRRAARGVDRAIGADIAHPHSWPRVHHRRNLAGDAPGKTTRFGRILIEACARTIKRLVKRFIDSSTTNRDVAVSPPHTSGRQGKAAS